MMKLPILTVWIAAALCCAGCGSYRAAPRDVSGKLVLKVIELDQEAMERSIQLRWVSDRLEKCLAELEAECGLEPIPFDWNIASGFPRPRSEANVAERSPAESTRLYVPYPEVKPLDITIKMYARYIDPRALSAYVSLKLRTRRASMLGMDKYIEHLGERLRRLDEFPHPERQQ